MPMTMWNSFGTFPVAWMQCTDLPARPFPESLQRRWTMPDGRTHTADRPGTAVTWETVWNKNPRERMKREKHPLDVLQELEDFIRRGYEAISEEDIVRLQWYGLYHDKPRVGHFMMRIKLPNGRITPEQLAAVGTLVQRFGDYAEITTRQDLQLHWIRLEDLPEVFHILRSCGLTTIGGCGDTIRNITGCPVAGIDADERFDSTPELQQLATFFYDPEHREYFNLPRKHKITVSACAYHCNYPEIHDIAFVGTFQNGQPGYAVWIGGGLSTYPRIARSLGVFVPRDQVLPVARAILDVWRTDPQNRLSFVKARLKFFVERIGVAAYRARVEDRLGYRLADLETEPRPRGRNFHVGVHRQKQPGYVYIGVPVPAGRLDARRIFALADLAARMQLQIRFSQRQNVMLTHVPERQLPEVLRCLQDLGFPMAASPLRAQSIACTSDPYCNFALNSSKNLLLDIIDDLESEFGPLHDVLIGADGCPHACAHHWVADIGLMASYRRHPDGRVESALMIILGGGYGQEAAVGRVIARRVSVPEAKRYLRNLIRVYRQTGPWPSFRTFVTQYSDAELLEIMQSGHVPTVGSLPETHDAAVRSPSEPSRTG